MNLQSDMHPEAGKWKKKTSALAHMLAKAFHVSNPPHWEELHGNPGQLTLKGEEGKEELLQG